MAWVKLIVQMVLFAIIILAAYNLLKRYVLSKVKINKWVVFVIAMIALVVPNLLAGLLHLNVQNNPFWVYGPSGLFILLFLWFMDLSGYTKRRGSSATAATTTTYGRKDKKKDIIIKPKAKPNRIKNKKD